MAVSDDEMKKALKAFKKRMKMTQLEEDSRLGRGLSRPHAQITAIQAPPGFGREVWEELADKGFLRRDGGGFYALVEGK